MKKLLLIALAVVATLGTAMAQTSSGEAIMLSTPTHVPTDTVVNTGSKTQKLFTTGNALNSATSFQVRITAISGTPAGVVRLYASDDDVAYVRINPTDSLNVNANALSKIFVVQGAVYKHYQLTYVGSGTMSMKMNSKAVWRRNKE